VKQQLARASGGQALAAPRRLRGGGRARIVTAVSLLTDLAGRRMLSGKIAQRFATGPLRQ
jgi:hypothetical protein